MDLLSVVGLTQMDLLYVVRLTQMDLLECCGAYTSGLAAVLRDLLKWTYSSVVGLTQMNLL